jgi:ADP-ribosylglycohydrolase
MATSNHIRDVRGMRSAPRCQARTKAGNRCQKPALKAQALCEMHSKSDVNGEKNSSASRERRSVRALRWELDGEVRQIEKDIRRRKRSGGSSEEIHSLDMRRSKLQRIAELTTDEFLAQYGNRNQDPVEASYIPATVARPRNIEHGHAQRTLNLDRAHGTPNQGPVETPSRPTAVASPPNVDPDAALRALRLDRARGAMLGLAIGEALGVTTHGWDRGFPEMMDMYGGGRLGLKRGEWAADTAAMLALAESLSATPSLDERDYIERLVDGFDNGTYSCTGSFVGAENSTLVSIWNYKTHGQVPARDPSVPRPSNGCLARMAPVAVRFWNQEIKRHDVARRQSRLTHAGYALDHLSQTWVDMLAQSIEFGHRPMVLTNRIVDERLGECVNYGMLRNLPERWAESGEDAEKSLAAAAWCVAKGDGFKDSALKAMNLGGDACSIAAMTGQLAGAIYGAKAIPTEWLEELAWGDRILAAADVLFDQSQSDA